MVMLELLPPRVDLGALGRLNAKLKTDDWPRVMTTLDPQYWRGGEAFWLQCVDVDGFGPEEYRTVFVIGARLLYIDNMNEALPALRLFYEAAKPGTVFGRAECCYLQDGLELSHISGQVCCDAGLWVAPEYRGQRLSVTAIELLHAAALARWQPDWFFGLKESKLAKTQLAMAQDYEAMVPMVRWENTPYGRDFEMHACWASRRYVLSNLVWRHTTGEVQELGPRVKRDSAAPA